MPHLWAHHAPGLRRKSLLSALLLSVAFSSAPAQSVKPPAPSAPSATPTSHQPDTAPSITTTAEEVSLDLVVRNKHDKPVLDLTPADLFITDNGSPVKLTDLHLVNGASQSQHLVTLVFDRLDPGPAKTSREIAAKILRAIPDKGYSFAVLQMNGRLRLIQPYTGNPDLIQKAIATATSPASGAPPTELSPAEKDILSIAQGDSLSVDSTERANARLLLSGLEESQRILEDQHTYPSLSALLALARTQRQITGRKLVIYFAQGLYADSDARDTIKSVVGQANRAGVTLCTVDTSALDQQVSDKMKSAMAIASLNVGSALSSADALGASGYGRGQSGPPIGQVMDNAQNMSRMEFDSMEESKSPLVNLATGTGGIYIKAGANLSKPLQQLHDDLTTYYQAAYVPAIKVYNGQFRPVDIQPLRKGLVIRSRSGYFALPPDNGTGIRPFEVPLLSILASPQLPTDIGFRMAVLHLGQLPDGNTGALTVEVPVSQLQIHDDANTHLSSVHVTIVAQIKNDKGGLLQRFSEDIPRHETPDMLRSDEGQVITMQRHFSADPGEYTLETAVLDRLGNKSGAQRTKFTIAPIPHGPALGDIALVRTVEPMHEETSTFEPMRYMDGRVIPDLSAELPENTRSLSLLHGASARWQHQPTAA